MPLNWEILIYQANSLLFRLRWWQCSSKPSKVLQMVNVNVITIIFTPIMCVFEFTEAVTVMDRNARMSWLAVVPHPNESNAQGVTKQEPFLWTVHRMLSHLLKIIASQFRCTKCKGRGFVDASRNSDVGTKIQVQHRYNSHNLDPFGPWGQFHLQDLPNVQRKRIPSSSKS